MTHATVGNDPGRPLLVAIVEELDDHGLRPDEYVLHDVVDPEVLSTLVKSGGDVTVQFTVHEVRVTVTSDGVTATDCSRDR